MQRFLRRGLGGKPGRDRAGEEDFRLLAESSGDVILRIGPNSVVQYASPSVFSVFGWRPEEMVGRGPGGFVYAEDIPLVIGSDRRRLAGAALESDKIATIRMMHKDGTLRWVETTARAAPDPVSGKPQSIVLVIRDVTERKLRDDALAELALTDPLTGLGNRRAFDQTLVQEWQRTLRDGSALSLMLVDLDKFKEFNDQFGHMAGDDCLRTVAAAVRGAVRRPGDRAARFGGEELAVTMPATDAAGAAEVAEAVRQAIAALRVPHPGNPEGDGWVTGSIGVATALCRVGATRKMPEALLAAADAALYRAKAQGRNCVVSTLLLALDERGGEE